jgi:hypothetical protein
MLRARSQGGSNMNLLKMSALSALALGVTVGLARPASAGC